jgi:hypothetical protein
MLMKVEDLEITLLFFYDNREDYKWYKNISAYLNSVKPYTKIEVQLIIQKLVKDGYILEEIQPTHHFDGKTHEYKYTDEHQGYFITYDGIIFVEAPTEEYKNRPYQYYLDNQKRKERAERIEKWPKRFWWLIAIITFIFGFIADIGKKWLTRKILPDTNQSAPSTQLKFDILFRQRGNL